MEKRYNHNFRCRDCKHKWSIEIAEVDVNKVFPNFCPNCGAKKSDAKLEWVFTPPIIKNEKEKIRKINREASRDALGMAMEQQAITPKEEMVTIERPEGASSRYGNATETVPKRIVDTLKERGEKFLG